MAIPGNDALLSGPVLRITNLRRDWNDEPEDGSIIAVLVGVARYARDAATSDKRANAILRVNPLAGPNAGLLFCW